LTYDHIDLGIRLVILMVLMGEDQKKNWK